MELTSQKMRKLAPEMDPLRIGCGWNKEDLYKPQIMIESTSGDSHPGSAHLPILVEEARRGIFDAGGFGARYACTEPGNGRNQFLFGKPGDDRQHDRDPRQRYAF